IEDCYKNVTEKCGVVNNNMSNNVEGEILEDHFDGDRRNDIIEDNADVNPSTNVYLDCRVRPVAAVNDSSIVSPSTPLGTVINLSEESCSMWLDYVGPLITDELDSEKRLSYRDPDGNVQGSFSLAQLRMKQIKNEYHTNVMYEIAKVTGKLQIFVAHTPIDLITVLIPNDGSFEQSLADVISEETKIITQISTSNAEKKE
nr:oligopeptide transporter [Tanacetum cinerariifolium]